MKRDRKSTNLFAAPALLPALSVLVATSTLLLTGCQPPQNKDADAAKSANEESPTEIAPTKAHVGVGKSSQAMEREGIQGAVASPARTLFRTKEKVVFEIQIPHAMNLYKALNGHGPRSHEEFMKEIIKANNIELPELPPGQHYQFDVEKQELWVVPDEPAKQEPGS